MIPNYAHELQPDIGKFFFKSMGKSQQAGKIQAPKTAPSRNDSLY